MNSNDEKLLDKVADKIEKLDERLDSIDKTLVKQEANLKEHMRRTELLEEDLRPIRRHVNMLEGSLKFLGVVLIVLSIISVFMKIYGLI